MRAGTRRPAARYDVVELADEFIEALHAQLDYLREMRNAEQFSANFASDPWSRSHASSLSSQHHA